ncbi:uncharacterized protein LOC119459666 isoform X2 [Dermacentor silvarum]|uniref:uncharacterized protein LOC119459666 isoform X2 n=1 Tax=Dermacentor silvarum TaxID=543639 RepID=UPI002100D5DC|nr:uncharacterized protein LOC119459666 isoform X2 [Dermacentor silvarum]
MKVPVLFRSPEKNRSSRRVSQAVALMMMLSLKELKRAKTDACYWCCRYEASAKENAELWGIVASMNNSIDVKLSTIVEMMESRKVELPKVQESRTGGSSRDENYFVEYPDFEVPPSLAQENPPSPIPSTMTGDLMRQPAEEPLAAAHLEAATEKAFTNIGGGRYHVTNGFCIGSQQAEKIMAQKKPSLVAKDMAQAIRDVRSFQIEHTVVN